LPTFRLTGFVPSSVVTVSVTQGGRSAGPLTLTWGQPLSVTLQSRTGGVLIAGFGPVPAAPVVGPTQNGVTINA
jgi:hypothetical protein